MAVPLQYQPKLNRKSEQFAYARNPTGTADALHERIIPDCYKRIDITSSKKNRMRRKELHLARSC